MSKLDQIDKKILHELDLNTRLPISIIAKKLKIGRDVVKYRMNRLEKQNIITGYRAFIDSSKLGYYIYRIYFNFYSISKKELDELIKTLNEDNKVFWVGETDGFVDFVFGIWFQEEAEFHNFYIKLMEKFRRVIKKDYVHRVLHNNYLDRAYILEKKNEQRKEFKLGGEEKEKYDNTDIKLMHLLIRNARTNIIEIANALNIDNATVIYRIKQLEKKKIILGYRVDLNLNKLRREFYTVKMYLSNFERKEEILAYLKSIPYVTNFIEAIGSWDIEFDLEVQSSKEYHDLMFDLKEKYNEISEIQFFRAPKIYKVIDMPC